MTNPTPHGQVPEALIDLIDAYAETRHRCGGIYNARTEAARKAVIEALSGVQALSAAPAGWKLVPVEPTVDQEWAGKNAALRCSTMGEACKIYKAMLAASPPAAQPIGEVVVTKTEYGQIVSVTRQDDEGRILSVIATSDPAEQQAAPKAAPGVGNSGFDHQTAADFLNGKTVSDESVRKFVQASRWAHDEKASLSAMLLSVRGELASREAEIALLKKALMEAEAAPQQEAQEPCPTCVALARAVMLDQVSFDRKPDCYGIRQITDDEGVEEWEDIRTSPDVAREEANDMMATGRGEIYEVVPLYAAPQPALALSDDVVKDAARLDWLESQSQVNIERVRYLGADTSIYEVTPFNSTDYNGETLREAIDAALAAQGDTP